jgi:hypothetical protein
MLYTKLATHVTVYRDDTRRFIVYIQPENHQSVATASKPAHRMTNVASIATTQRLLKDQP